MNRIVDERLLAALLRYLATKPYQEVAEIIAALQSLPEESVEEKKKVK